MAAHRPPAEASFTDRDVFTGMVKQAVTGLAHLAVTMADPGGAAQILLDLADRPMLRVAGDHVRYRLAAAALLFQAGDLRAAEGTIQDTLNRCETLDSPLAGACRIFLRLVAEGLSTPDIADRLFISRATVKTHLAHVFTKLGVINRAQLVALTTRAITEGTVSRD